MATLGYLHSTESFGAVDGPGVRFVVFLQGCKMRCQYCHNPETWEIVKDEADVERLKAKGIRLEVRTPEDVLRQAMSYQPYWKNGGGITVSGGEALLQIDWVIEFFKLAKKQGIHTALDTAGNPFTKEEPFFSKFQELMEVTDLFILDLKQINEDKHKDLTGHSNQNILELAKYLSDHGKHMWIRHVLVPGITTEEEDLRKTDEFIRGLNNVDKVEVLPYHKLGIPEWQRLGIPYKLEGVEPPAPEVTAMAKEILETGR